MELKLHSDVSLMMRIDVLIVPLWNWNKDSSNSSRKEEGSNRTFMELKLGLRHIQLERRRCSNRTFMELKSITTITSEKRRGRSNRTFMELKYGFYAWTTSERCGSNRTFMELKFENSYTLSSEHDVLIVPLWNWNRTLHWAFHATAARSNRTFMELK